jgi:hypothetical protein
VTVLAFAAGECRPVEMPEPKLLFTMPPRPRPGRCFSPAGVNPALYLRISSAASGSKSGGREAPLDAIVGDGLSVVRFKLAEMVKTASTAPIRYARTVRRTGGEIEAAAYLDDSGESVVVKMCWLRYGRFVGGGEVLRVEEKQNILLRGSLTRVPRKTTTPRGLASFEGNGLYNTRG